MKDELTGSPKLLEIVDMTVFSRDCIKTCINNVTLKKRQTLLNQRGAAPQKLELKN